MFIDVHGRFEQLNRFPSDVRLQTFLLNQYNEVLVIGNPIYNPDVKGLYLDVIQGKEVCRGREQKYLKQQ